MPVNRENRFLLLYGSQTGQAKAIAEEIAEQAEAHNLHADIHCLSMTEKKFFIERENCVVIVTSTTGDGEPPDTALKFVRRLKKRTLPANYLSHLNYALLGLGDSNYTNFCKCGKSLDRRLQDLGAKHFYSSGWGDDAVGLEVAVEPWIDGLWPALKKQLNGSFHCDETRDANLPSDDIRDTTTNVENKTLQNGVLPNHSHTNTTVSECATRESVACRTTSNNFTNSEQHGEYCNSTKNDKEKVKSEVSGVTNSLTNLAVNDQSTSLDSLPTSVNSHPCQEIVSQPEGSDNSFPQTKKVRDSSNELSKTPDNIHLDLTKSVTEDTKENLSLPVVPPDVPSIQRSVPPLSETNLSVPVLSPAYLKIDYSSSQELNISQLPFQNGCIFPSAASPVTMATVVSATTMTTKDAVKKAMVVNLDISVSSDSFHTTFHTENVGLERSGYQGCSIQYQPGDSFSLICPNDAEEVDTLLQRLGQTETADKVYQLTVLPDTKKKNAAVPKHVPEKDTLRHLFTTCLDIREPPKKALLRVLVEYTSDPGEKRRLQELCSRQGSDDYAKYIREPSLSLLDIFNHFRSCCPPVERIIEHLPRLQPRPYSICSSPLTSPGSVEFVFNVLELDATHGRSYSRKGVCTGWMEKFEAVSEEKTEIADQMENCSLSSTIQVPVFARTNQHFHLPTDSTTPVIMIGPGTGVAPFVGFLKHRSALRETTPDRVFGDAWLFYGCRHKDRDYLYRDELDHHVKTGNLTKLCVSFSQDEQPENAPRYVQHNIRINGEELVKLLDNREAVIYVCGDAKNMAKDVNQAFVDVISTVKGISQDEAGKVVMKLRLHKRYLEDVWT